MGGRQGRLATSVVLGLVEVDLADSDMRGWALKGAAQRLLEMAEEAKAIYATFPELRDQGRGFPASSGAPRRGRPRKNEAARDAPTPHKRRRRKMSKEARRKISEAQKARWAKQRGKVEPSAEAAVKPSRKGGAQKKK